MSAERHEGELDGSGVLPERARVAEAHVTALQDHIADITAELARAGINSRSLGASAEVLLT